MRPSRRSCSTKRTVSSTEVKVVVDALSIDEADINLFCAGWHVGVADPA